MGKDLKGKELGKGISQRADGRYIARFTSKTGKRKTLYDFKLNELKRKLREAVYEDEHGLNGNGESITLNAWYVTWTELYKKKTVKMTTIYKNHSYYNARVKNSIGKMYLQDIKTYHVQKFINELIDSGLAHGTVSNIRFMLSDMFDKAVLSEYIRKNPCIGAKRSEKGKACINKSGTGKILYICFFLHTHQCFEICCDNRLSDWRSAWTEMGRLRL